MRIDTSQVPQDKLNDPRFVQLRSEMEAVLRNPRWVRVLCAHEAAHAIYFLRAGITALTFVGTRILYDAQRDLFSGHMASVQFSAFDRDLLPRINISEWILATAKAHAAGGVVVLKLTDAPDTGDEEDYEEFAAFCDTICAKHPDTTIDPSGLWRLAQDAVGKDLQSPAFRIEVWKKADEIRSQLFGSP